MFSTRSIASRRGARLVFRGINIDLAEGGLLLVAGRNGSGKSSLLRALAGLLPLYEGEMLWRGESITDMATHHAQLHYLGHLDALKPERTLAETLNYWRVLRGAAAGGDVLEEFGLGGLHDMRVGNLSAGQKRRLALSRMALIDVPLWLLDEPNAALDSKGQELLARILARHRAQGGVAVIAAHHGDFAGAQELALDAA